MRIDPAALGGLLIAFHQVQHAACAAPSLVADADVHRRHLSVHGGLRHRGIERRQSSPSATPTASSDKEMDLAMWTAEVESACMDSMKALNGDAKNPSGMAACYNVPFLDSNSGVFEAEIRMYVINSPTGEWSGVTPKEMMVSLAYLGATVQQTNGSMMEIMPNEPAVKRSLEVSEAELLKRQTTMPNELKVLTYVGQLNSNIKGPQLNTTEVQALLIPEIELMAMNPAQDNKKVYTVLSDKQATFVKGVFSQEGTDTITPQAAASASDVAKVIAPFTVPGVDFGIFPTGFIVTTVWMILFLGAVGAGTVGRYNYAVQHQRNTRSAGAAAMKTI